MDAAKKILLIHLHSNGDCLYATAVARQIKQDYPGCHLTWAIASFCKTIIDNNPYVDAVWEIPGVNKDSNTHITRELKKTARKKKENGEYDEVFFTQIIDDNIANYDGCIRSAIFRGYGKPITVPVTPVLRLKNEEIEKVKAFAEKHELKKYKNVILFEFAPQSGQTEMTPSFALEIAKEILQNNRDTIIILSSNIKITDENKQIIDGSVLTLRETACLSNYCTFLLGCSSGITWASTSDAGKILPMVQILNPNAYWVNSIIRDFERNGFSTENIIEIYKVDMPTITNCVNEMLNSGFVQARKKFFTPLPLQFRTTRRSIYNMLCFFQFKAIVKHIRINVGVFGWNPLLIKEIILGFITTPFKLVYNIIKKNLIDNRAKK